MNESTRPTRTQTRTHTVTQTRTQTGELRALAFSDADSAKKWAHSLPLTNIALVCETVRGQLKALSAARLPARERATIAEVLRELVAYLHAELAKRYAGKPQPAIDRELEAATHAVGLWNGLWEQYSACLKPLLDGAPELAGVKSKIVQRGLYVGKQLVLVHGLTRRTIPRTIWHELHAYFKLAEILECAVTALSDDLMPNAIGISCYSTYSHALLLGLADPCALSVKQIELTDRWLAMWARKIFPYAQEREAERPVMLIDLEGDTGARLVPRVPDEAGESMRFGYPSKLAVSVRGRLKRLESGSSPADLQLGQDASSELCLALLGHLDAHWCQLERRAEATGTENVDLCAGGLPAAYFRVGGRSFDSKDPMLRMSFDEKQEVHTLGTLTDYDRGREVAEQEFAWERWQGAYSVRRATIARAYDGGMHRWSLDQLAIVQHGSELRVGQVARVAVEEDNALTMSLRFFPGVPKSVTMRPLSKVGPEDSLLPALLMEGVSAENTSLVLPPRTFNPSRVLRSVGGSGERTFRLVRLLHRGLDFERVAYAETT